MIEQSATKASLLLALLGLCALPATPVRAQTRDWPLYGGSPQRNMVNLVDKNVPVEWSVAEGETKNIKWVAELGSKAYGGPVIAGGRVYVGTNSEGGRNAKLKGAKAILMCFDAASGKFLWQTVHDIPADELFNEGRTSGLCSTPVVEDKHHYYVTNGCEVICAANDTGKVAWRYDMMKELKVVPHHLANCSPLVLGDLVMVITGNGTDGQGKVVNPSAPSFIAVNKNSGKLAWQSNLPGENIIEGQWSNPVAATVGGKPQVIFPGGDGVLYAFEPETGVLIWKCSGNPFREQNKAKRIANNYIISTPVVVEDRLYVGMGVYPEAPHTPTSSYFLCLDITKKGDVSPKSYDAKDPANKDSALVWAYGGPIVPAPAKGRRTYFEPTIATASVHDGLVYIPETAGYLNCLDAKTGQLQWSHDLKDSVWGSTLVVDGKVYLNAETGEVLIFRAGRKLELLRKNDMEEQALHSTPVVAHGVLYIATRNKLYAIAK